MANKMNLHVQENKSEDDKWAADNKPCVYIGHDKKIKTNGERE